jgi:hypothetical protein
VNTLYCLEEWRGEQRISSPGDNFTPRGKKSPLVTNSPLGSKFAPRGEVKNGPLFFGAPAQINGSMKLKKKHVFAHLILFQPFFLSAYIHSPLKNVFA